MQKFFIKQKIKFSPRLAKSIGKSEKEPMTYLKTIFSFAIACAVLFFIFSGLEKQNIPEKKSQNQEILGTSTSNLTNYEVLSGDTLVGISKKFNIFWMTIVEENELESPYDLVPGQILRIPIAK